MIIIKGLEDRRTQPSLHILKKIIQVGDYVELVNKGNEIEVNFDFFRLGRIPDGYDKEELLGYDFVIINEIEEKAVTLNFHLKCMTDEEHFKYTIDKKIAAHLEETEEKINRFLAKIEENNRIIKENQEKQKKEEDNLPNTPAFKKLANDFRWKLERNHSIVSKFVDDLKYGTGSDHNQKYFNQQIIIDQEKNNNAGSYAIMKRLNDQGRLEILLHKAVEEIKSKEETVRRLKEATKHIQRDTYTPPTIRETHCWKCKAQLSSRKHNKCRRCRWLVCSCGACNCNRY